MALISCPRCGNDISDKAPVCPKCGLPTPHSYLSDKSSTTEQRSLDSNQNSKGNASNLNNSSSSPSTPDNNRRRLIYLIIIPIFFGLIAAIAIYIFATRQDDNPENQNQKDLILSEKEYCDSIISDHSSSDYSSSEHSDYSYTSLDEDALKSLEQARREATSYDDFTTPDLILFDLHGHVKSVSFGFSSSLYYFLAISEEFHFNKNGTLTQQSGKDHISIRRNTHSQPIELENDPIKLSIKWNNNFPSNCELSSFNEGQEVSLSYYHGQLKKIESRYLGGNGGFTTTEAAIITPIQFDDHGNWIKAKIRTVGYEGGGNSLENYKPIDEENTISRTITYYSR